MGSKFKFAIPVILIALLSAMSLVFAATVPEWGTYHRNELRAGANEDQSPNASNIKLIWTFPRYDLVVGSAVVDIPDDGGWSTDGSTQWANPDANSATDGNGKGTPPGYKWTAATGDVASARWAKWDFPANKLEKGEYTVQVWFPSSRTAGDPNSSKVPYTVYWINKKGDLISNTIIINQTKGGSWVNLGNLSFDIDPSRDAKTVTLQDGQTITVDGACVVLSNVVDKSDLRDAANNPIDKIVCADAVRFLPGTAMEFYSSPAAGEAAVDISPYTGRIPAVWIGTIEGGLASGASGVKDFGAMYCIRSYLGTGFTPGDGAAGWNSKEALNVGTAAWRYPRGGSYDDPSRKAADRDPLEGPIGRIGEEGGIFSSPTLVPMPVTLAPSGYGVVFGAMDGQVYCLDSESGKLIWKGPGVTISETQQAKPTDWAAVPNRQDAFGGSFLQAKVTDDDSENDYIVYDIKTTNSDPGKDAASITKAGHYYAIYAWIPSVTGSDPSRARDAAYKIYSSTDPNSKPKTVRINQSDRELDAYYPPGSPAPEPDLIKQIPGAGRWVKLGDKFWNPVKVALSTQTLIKKITDPNDPSKIIDLPEETYVVADAIMVVPVEMSSFKYSTPVADSAGRIFAANTNGRVYCLQYNAANTDCAATLNWTFPKVQTKYPSSGIDDDAASPMGSIVASPTLYDDETLLVPSLDGKVYALTDLGGPEAVTAKHNRLLWTFTASEGDTIGTFEAFSSSASIKDDKAYVCSTGGRVYSIDLGANPATGTTDMPAEWSWPDKTTSEIPKSPFRYSTAATISGDKDDLYCATTGGSVYNLNPSSTTDKVAAGFIEGGASFYAPIQSSVAVDNNTLFVGTMGTGEGEDGGFYWLNRDEGAPATASQDIGYTGLGSVFSSPALANKYIYVGIGKGRLCAFSADNFGGNWVGGGEAGAGEGPFIQQKAVDPSLSEVNPHVDVFSKAIWDSTLTWATDNTAELGTTPIDDLATTAIFTDGNIDPAVDKDWATLSHKRAYGQKMGLTSYREVYYEWGETIYLIAWNLPPLDEISGGGGTAGSPVGSSGKRNSVKFNFTNASGGVGAGSTIPSLNADYLFEYSLGTKDANGNLIKRSFAMAKYTIDGNANRPPAPGPNWNISLTVLRATSSGTQSATPVAVVPILTGDTGAWKVEWKTSSKNSIKQWKEQPIGCNNPLSLAVDPAKPETGLAWIKNPSNGLYPASQRDTQFFNEKRFNGNSIIVGNNKYAQKNTDLYLGHGRHGASTIQVPVYVMDTSAMGCLLDSNNQPKAITNFRVQLGDLRWSGGNGAVINPLPWEQMPWTNYGAYISRTQRDYPNINSSQAQFQKISDNADPSSSKTRLEPVMADAQLSLVNAKFVPDPVNSSVNVPLYQPANKDNGYSTSVLAYVDSDGNGHFDGGDSYRGNPNTYSETYRKFNLYMNVAPDYHLVVDSPLSIDISGPDGSAAPHGLGIGLPWINLKDWYRTFSAKNLGNVNLPNIRIADRIYSGTESADVALFSDYVAGAHSILNKGTGFNRTGIVCSLDGVFDPNIIDLINPLNGEPYATDASRPFYPVSQSDLIGKYPTTNLGYVLSKPRVGDVNPTELKIPDERKLEWMVGAGLASPDIKPQDPSVSVRVPLSQPTGTYHTMVPLFSDTNQDGHLNVGTEAFADPTFRLNISVAENRITGGPTPGSATQVDGKNMPVSYGDVQPTAWRDPIDGNVYMFWSSNRYITGAPTPASPWYIGYKSLVYDTTVTGGVGELNWRLNDPLSPNPFWWCDLTGTTDNHLPASSWPVLTPEYRESSVKHSAPFAAMGAFEGDKTRDVMLFWQGQIDKTVNGKLQREYRLFYTPATGGVVTSPGDIYSFANDPSMIKLDPKAAYLKSTNDSVPDRMWLFYSGGAASKMNLFVNYNESPRGAHDTTKWSPDTKLQTPSSLASVADPMPIGRHIAAGPGGIIDVGYTGTSRYDQTPDILWTRYRWAASKMDFTIFPRVYNEELQKDSKLDVYTSEHLAWSRPGGGGDSSPNIRVVIPGDTPSETPIIILATAGTTQVDKSTGIYTYSYTAGEPADTKLGQMLVDYSGGVVRFTKALPPKTKVEADYTPQAMRLVRATEADTSPYMFIEGPSALKSRLWVFWRKTKSAAQSSTAVYYKTYRMTVQGFGNTLIDPVSNQTYDFNRVEMDGNPIDFNVSNGKIHLQSGMERYTNADSTGNKPFYESDPKFQLELIYRTTSGAEISKIADTVVWEEELSATALPTRQSVNDGQICAFADPSVSDTKIWIFWANTRSGESDIYYQTLSPNFQVIR